MEMFKNLNYFLVRMDGATKFLHSVLKCYNISVIQKESLISKWGNSIENVLLRPRSSLEADTSILFMRGLEDRIDLERLRPNACFDTSVKELLSKECQRIDEGM